MLKISKQEIKIILLLLPFCTFAFSGFPGSLNGLLSTAFEGYKILSILVFFYLYRVKKSDFTPLIICIALYEISYLIPSFINGAFAMRTAYLWAKGFLTSFFLALILTRMLREDYTKTLKAVYHMLSAILILHIILNLFAGMSILGIRTRFGDSFTVAVIFMLIVKKITKERYRAYDFVFILLSEFFIFSQKISTMIILSLILFIVVAGSKNRFVKALIKAMSHYYAVLVAGITLNFSVVVLHIQNLFKWLIVDILHEDLTLNNRTIIWHKTFEDLKHYNILFGRGITGENTKSVPMTIKNIYGHVTIGDRQAHNQLVSVIYWNGLIGLCCYIAMIAVAGMNLKKCKDSDIVAYFIIGMGVILLSMITELAADGSYFVFFLTTLYMIPSMHEVISVKEEN